MPDAGTEFLKKQMKNNNSWTDRIKEWKEQKGTLCLLPDNAGDESLEDL